MLVYSVFLKIPLPLPCIIYINCQVTSQSLNFFLHKIYNNIYLKALLKLNKIIYFGFLAQFLTHIRHRINSSLSHLIPCPLRCDAKKDNYLFKYTIS